LEGIGSDLTLADVAELSMDEIESIMERLQDDGNSDFDAVRFSTIDLQDMINENPCATKVSDCKDSMANWNLIKVPSKHDDVVESKSNEHLLVADCDDEELHATDCDVLPIITQSQSAVSN
jgi:hypothetical protein